MIDANIVNGSVIAAVAIFIATQTISVSTYLYRAHKTRKNTAINLYIEAHNNLLQIKESLNRENYEEKLLEFVSDSDRKVPVWIFTTQEMVFNNSIAQVLDLRPDVAVPALELYNTLEKIRALVNSLETKGFASISTEGRRKIIKDIMEYNREAAGRCDNLLRALEYAYGERTFYPVRFPWRRNRSDIRRKWPLCHFTKLHLTRTTILLYQNPTKANLRKQLSKPWLKN